MSVYTDLVDYITHKKLVSMQYLNKLGANDAYIKNKIETTIMNIALGAANLKLFVNAAGTAPEFAEGAKMGTFTRNISLTGDVAYTGVGFKPSKIIFLACVDATSMVSIGLSDGSNHYAIYDKHQVTATSWGVIGSKCIYLLYNGSPTHGNALVKSMDADGFTLTWAKTSSPTGTADIYYIAFR